LVLLGALFQGSVGSTAVESQEAVVSKYWRMSRSESLKVVEKASREE
jgi:hypothetical protein